MEGCICFGSRFASEDCQLQDFLVESLLAIRYGAKTGATHTVAACHDGSSIAVERIINEERFGAGCESVGLEGNLLTAHLCGHNAAIFQEVETDGGTAQVVGPFGASDIGTAETSSTTFLVTATPGAYFVRVRARNAAGIGTASGDVRVEVP